MGKHSRRAFCNFYDELRDAELNKEYYAKRIRETRRRLRFIDIYLAIFATGSGVAGFALWSYQVGGIQIGQIAFGLLAGIAAVVLISKPYLKLEDDVERLSGIQSTYASMSHILGDIVRNIMAQKDISETDKSNYSILRQMRVSLEPKEDKPANRDLVDKMQAHVNDRYPSQWFWYPDEDTENNSEH